MSPYAALRGSLTEKPPRSLHGTEDPLSEVTGGFRVILSLAVPAIHPFEPRRGSQAGLMLATILSGTRETTRGSPERKVTEPAVHCCAENLTSIPWFARNVEDVVMYVLRGAETTAELLIRAGSSDLIEQLDAEVARGVFAAWGKGRRGEYDVAREAGYTESFILDEILLEGGVSEIPPHGDNAEDDDGKDEVAAGNRKATEESGGPRGGG